MKMGQEGVERHEERHPEQETTRRRDPADLAELFGLLDGRIEQ